MVLYKLMCTVSLLASITCTSVSSMAGMAPITHHTSPGVSTVPQPERQTSDYWYRHLQTGDSSPEYIIVDPDGWRMLRDPQHFWYHGKITYADYQKRVMVSSIIMDGTISAKDKPAPF